MLRCGASSACGTSETQITSVTDSLWSKIGGASISDSSDKRYRVEDLHNATFLQLRQTFALEFYSKETLRVLLK